MVLLRVFGIFGTKSPFTTLIFAWVVFWWGILILAKKKKSHNYGKNKSEFALSKKSITFGTVADITLNMKLYLCYRKQAKQDAKLTHSVCVCRLYVTQRQISSKSGPFRVSQIQSSDNLEPFNARVKGQAGRGGSTAQAAPNVFSPFQKHCLLIRSSWCTSIFNKRKL